MRRNKKLFLTALSVFLLSGGLLSPITAVSANAVNPRMDLCRPLNTGHINGSTATAFFLTSSGQNLHAAQAAQPGARITNIGSTANNRTQVTMNGFTGWVASYRVTRDMSNCPLPMNGNLNIN